MFAARMQAIDRYLRKTHQGSIFECKCSYGFTVYLLLFGESQVRQFVSVLSDQPPHPLAQHCQAPFTHRQSAPIGCGLCEASTSARIAAIKCMVGSLQISPLRSMCWHILSAVGEVMFYFLLRTVLRSLSIASSISVAVH